MTYKHLLFYHHPVTANLILRTDLIKKNKFQKSVGEDVDIILRILKKGYEIIYEPRMFVLHRHRRNFKDFIKHFSKITSYYPKFIITHKVNPILLRRILYLLPYLVLLLSMFLIIKYGELTLIPFITSFLLIYLYYLNKTRSLVDSCILIVLDFLTQFIIVPVSFLRRWIRSD